MSIQDGRRLQFSLRATLVVIALFAAFLGWYANHIGHRRQIDELQKQLKATQKHLASTSWELAQVQRGLAHVQLDKANVTDPLVRTLVEQQANFETLNKRGQMRDVSLRASGMTDQQLNQLLSVSSLERLDLRGTQITDAGLTRLKELPHLECLILWNTDISDRGLMHVVETRTIRQLYLPRGISDDGMAMLCQLTNLEVLDLQECIYVGEEGFKHVEQLKQLKTLLLSRGCADRIVARLRQALPTCQITDL